MAKFTTWRSHPLRDTGIRMPCDRDREPRRETRTETEMPHAPRAATARDTAERDKIIRDRIARNRARKKSACGAADDCTVLEIAALYGFPYRVRWED